MKKAIIATVLFVLVFSVAVTFVVETVQAQWWCEQTLRRCLDRAWSWYQDCLLRSEEAQCNWVYDIMVGNCYNAYWNCRYG